VGGGRGEFGAVGRGVGVGGVWWGDVERKRVEVGYEEVVWGGFVGVARAGLVSHCESSGGIKMRRSMERETRERSVRSSGQQLAVAAACLSPVE
jgi:hypothetical protein